MKELVEFLVVVGLMGLLYLLRLDAQRFRVAEYDDSERDATWRGWSRRLGWYLLGLGLILLVYWLYPQPVTILHLDMGPDRERALIYALAAGIGGLVLGFLFAWFRYGGFRLPAPGAYPGAILNSVGTAVIDEALFRGIMLGLMLQAGVSSTVAIAIQAIAYGIATRLWIKGRSKGMLGIDLVIAVVGGWLVIETGGIGAAVVAHAITRFGVFLATGHTDQARPVGWAPEEVAGRALPPEGWDLVGDDAAVQPWTASAAGPPGLGPMYAGQSPFAPPGYGGVQGYPGVVPPPGLSSAPMNGPGPYPDAAWGPPPGYPDPGVHQGGPDPSSGPWVADPETGAWSPAPQGPWMPDGQSSPWTTAQQPPDGWQGEGQQGQQGQWAQAGQAAPWPPEGEQPIWPPPAEAWTQPPDGSDGQPHG